MAVMNQIRGDIDGLVRTLIWMKMKGSIADEMSEVSTILNLLTYYEPTIPLQVRTAQQKIPPLMWVEAMGSRSLKSPT
jgi:hypothetical protein